MYFLNELCYTLIISIFGFLIFIHFTNLTTPKQSLAKKLNLIFQLSSINWQIIFHFGHAWVITDEQRMEKLLPGVIPLL